MEIKKIIFYVTFLFIMAIISGCVTSSQVSSDENKGVNPISTITTIKNSNGIVKSIPTSDIQTHNTLSNLKNNNNDGAIPKMNIQVEAAGNIIYLYHNGGDSLGKSNLLVKINGQVIPTDFITLLHSQEWPWSTGKTIKIQYSGKDEPQKLEIIYKTANTQNIIISQPITTPAPIPM